MNPAYGHHFPTKKGIVFPRYLDTNRMLNKQPCLPRNLLLQWPSHSWAEQKYDPQRAVAGNEQITKGKLDMEGFPCLNLTIPRNELIHSHAPIDELSFDDLHI